MANISSYSYLQSSSNRITGLASGIDTESMVEKLMQAQSAQMEKLQQQKQKYEWQRDSYREVNTKLSTFEKTFFDEFGLQNKYPSKTVNISDSTKVSVTASGTANGSLSIESVKQLATAGKATTVTLPQGVEKNTKLSELPSFPGQDGMLTLSVLQNDGSMKEVKVAYKGTDTITDFTGKLNKVGLTALFANGQMSLKANVTGEPQDGKAGSVRFVSDNTMENGVESTNSQSKGIMELLGFDTINPLVENGQNAIYKINGIEMESQSNQVSINGYSITLKQTFAEDPNNANAVTVTSTTDTDAMVDKMKDFITLYNDLMTSLNDKIGEAKYKDYAPLTDAQRSQMTEDQIKKWEEKAKSGLLRNDSIISNALNNLRGTLYKSVDFGDGKGKALFEIGITTTKDYNDGGKLEINETKLREALTKDPESVMKIFTQPDTGIVAQMRKISQNTVKEIEERAGKASSVDNTYTLGKQLESLTDKITDWKDRLKIIENRYWKQFSAMEDAIARANSQASYFAQ
ncbi:flagellar filament capping protein FliD [Rummeliibacillus sp. G93]|uniref:flagellar filament capping protein FliD n=1 Tax=Rummeliibacillus sp. G93 TaxID=2939494 RepID=UPI00201BDBB2|nr:flagellar filament capping protein FliD [Rummeliibacillus sp. G93]UQW98056.1 flagellar filament capping protein FliD [Rummeliibacillus sp. G93]